jgi:hypothetical protein
MKKDDAWVFGLTWSDTELEAISRGMGSEAFSYTFRRSVPTKAQMLGAKKELQLIKRRRARRRKSFPGLTKMSKVGK